MRIQTKMKMVFFVLAAFLLLPIAAQASVSIACYCTDNDGDGYGDPSTEDCTHVGLDCDDNPCDDPEGCDTCSCGTPECGKCARCIYPGAMEVCDGVDNNCDGSTDEEPGASASCDDGLYCNGQESCNSGVCEPGEAPCSDGNDCTSDNCNEEGDSCEYLCIATGYEDPCCDDPACVNEPVCKEPVCGDGVIDPGEQCGEPGLDACPPESKFCVKCVCSSVAIELSYLNATGADGTVLIEWGTESEIDNAGFNILRSEEELGQYTQINQDLIPAEGSPVSGADYSYTDNDVVNGTTYWYKLDDRDIYGVSTLHGPRSATPEAATEGWAASPAEAAAIGASKSKPLNALYPVTLPLLVIGVWLGRAVYRRRR